MPIMKLRPACKDYLWGGDRLKTLYHKQFGGERLAETWELSCHPDGPSVIETGPFSGKTLREYIGIQGKGVLGSNCQVFEDFPILIKLIDAKEDLSIQVHPNNVYALSHEGQYGKTEMWYVLEADPGAYLYYGLRREISREELRQRIGDGTLTDVLNAVPARRGDLFYIPAGTIHAIRRGLVIAEIQQSSNVTYRVSDYGRLGTDGKPRALHVEQAAAVASLTPPRTDYDFGRHLARNMYFTVDLREGPGELCCGEESFLSLLVLEGEGEAACGGDVLPCRKGDSLFLPAGSGTVAFSGGLRLLCTQVGTI